MNFNNSLSPLVITHMFADWIENTDWTEYELFRFREANINAFAETLWESSHFWGGCQGGREQLAHFLEAIATLERHYTHIVSRAIQEVNRRTAVGV